MVPNANDEMAELLYQALVLVNIPTVLRDVHTRKDHD